MSSATTTPPSMEMATASAPPPSFLNVTESQHRIDALSAALASISGSTTGAMRCCEQLARRSKHLDSLTSPASDASALLTQASENLSSTLSLMKDAREKFDTVSDCEPAILRLLRGAQEAIETRRAGGSGNSPIGAGSSAGRRGGGSSRDVGLSAFMPDRDPFGGQSNNALSEQDVYAAADSMEIIRDGYEYFLQRTSWKSTPTTLTDLERVHQSGVDAMCLLITSHLTAAGPAVRLKRDQTSDGKRRKTLELAHETRKRLADALQNRDLMAAVGEYENFLPLDTRPVRELRAMIECLSGEGSFLGPAHRRPAIPPSPELSKNKLVRTEKVGSGAYSNLTKTRLVTSFPQIDAYGEARKAIAFASIDGYYRHLRNEHKKRLINRTGSMSAGMQDGSNEADAAARDAVRCLEHAMVVLAGEKDVFRAVVLPSSSSSFHDDTVSSFYRTAQLRGYSHVASAVVDRTMDIIEVAFFKELGIAEALTTTSSSTSVDSASSLRNNVRNAAFAVAAGLRIQDGVRILGPSLAKLCDLPESIASGDSGASIAGSLCISIHRTTVRNCARTLETLVKAIQNNPLNGDAYRPSDCRVAPVSSDVVRAIRLISPCVSAYKSVTKRRALPWDPKIGEDADDIEVFVRFLIGRLLGNLKAKAGKYMDDHDLAASCKAPLFMINNTYYLMEQLGSGSSSKHGRSEDTVEKCTLDAPWFKQKVGSLFQLQKEIYLAHWEILNKHLSMIDKGELVYQNTSSLLSLESGRLLKGRFSQFSDEYERIYELHKPLTVIDSKLREMMQNDVRNVFLPRYKKFYDQYSRIQFSKKNQGQYLKYPPQVVDGMISELYETL